LIDEYPDIPFFDEQLVRSSSVANCLNMGSSSVPKQPVAQIGIWEHKGLVDMIASTWAGEVDFGLSRVQRPQQSPPQMV
jgi:hypothetical protein